MPRFTWEQWGDLVTLSIFALMFWVMFIAEIRRTWKWDALGKALTILTGALAILYTIGVASFFSEAFRPFYVRWTARIVGSIAAAVVIAVLALDDPDRGVNEQLRWLAHRFWNRVRRKRPEELKR